MTTSRKLVKKSDGLVLPPRSMIVAAAQGEIAAIKAHLKAGGHPDATIVGKPTALGYSAIQDSIELAWSLIRAGACLDYQDGVGNTPLIYAALSGSADVMELLLNNGADALLVNKVGHTMRHYIGCGNRNVYAMMRLAKLHCSSTRPSAGENDIKTYH